MMEDYMKLAFSIAGVVIVFILTYNKVKKHK